MYFMVFEERPDAIVNGRTQQSAIPLYDNLQTVVEADTPEEALNIVIAATRRVGRYAVLEVSHVNFTDAGGEVAQEGGILRRKETLEQQIARREKQLGIGTEEKE